jgi:hypothetical protein
MPHAPVKKTNKTVYSKSHFKNNIWLSF